jgi:hypothetical protein
MRRCRWSRQIDVQDKKHASLFGGIFKSMETSKQDEQLEKRLMNLETTLAQQQTNLERVELVSYYAVVRWI